jgi:acetyl esterase
LRDQRPGGDPGCWSGGDPVTLMPMVSEQDLAEVEQTRASMEAEALEDLREDVKRVEEVSAAGVPCRLYVPDGADGLLLYLHGGGFVYGDLDTHDAHCRRMARRTGWAVLAVHYRRAPEHAYPAAVEDAETVGVWLETGPAEIDGLGGRLVASGDSAGANLALGLTLRHRSLFEALVLVYPFLDPSCSSYDATVPDPDFGIDDLAWFWKLYVQDADASHVDVDPLRSAEFRGLPRTLVQLAELDVLTTTGRGLVQRLADDEVAVETITYPGVGHGFWRHDDNDQHEPALADLVRFLRS